MARSSTAPQKEPNILIALCGVTGAGKTTFASLASGNTSLKIGHGVDPCTQEPQKIEFVLKSKLEDGTTDRRTIVLIDTPGFDDDLRSDVEILEGIATWMAKTETMKEHLLDGLIFLHPVTYNRVGGSERNRTRLLQKILGKHAYKRVLIATTMWEDLKSEEAAQSRLDGRTSAGGVWHDMCSQGAILLRHDNNQESAHRIIRRVIKIADDSGKMEPLMQTELRHHHGRVVRTSAGKELKKQLEESIKQIKDGLDRHFENAPPEDWRKHEDKRKRKDYRAWDKERKDLEERLELREQQLKRLGGMVVRVKRFFAALFGIF